MILLGDTSLAELENLSGVLSTYGITPAEGYIADPSRCYQNNPYYIFPELTVSGDLAEGISSQMVLLTNTHGMTQADPERDTITVTPFMSSSEQSYAVTEEAQEQGSYVLGAVATETVSAADDSEGGASDSSTEETDASDSGTETADTSDSGTEDADASDTGEELESRLTVISAASLIDPAITDTFTQLENTQVFMNAVSANFEGVQNLSIEAKSLNVEYNTVQHGGLFSLLMIFGIPAVILIGGFAVWFRRRKV